MTDIPKLAASAGGQLNGLILNDARRVTTGATLDNVAINGPPSPSARPAVRAYLMEQDSQALARLAEGD